MNTITLVVVFLFYFASLVSSQGLTPTISQNGAYSIAVDGVEWFSGAYTKLFTAGTWYSSDDQSLKLAQYSTASGTDAFGKYSLYNYSWLAGATYFQTYIKTYPSNPNVVVFGQVFESTVLNTSVGNANQPISIFPSLLPTQKLGYIHYYNDMAGSNFQYGVFPSNYQGGLMGGPLVLFDSNYNTVVFSALSYFISAISNVNSTDGTIVAGIQGKCQQIPASLNIEYIMFYGAGINTAMMGWGDLMLAKYGKTRVLPTVSVVISYLGYSTTGYYFYNPLDGNQSYGNYETTMLQFNDYSTQLGIPYHYYLLDSWWYGEQLYKDGVYMWEDNHDLLQYRFPHGLEWLHDRLGMPFAAHMGKWVSFSPYASNPDYGFIVETDWALPTSFEFYDYIFQNASGWGLNTLKQDHIDEQIVDMIATLADPITARQWILAEGRGAAHHGINIEYCMDWPSIVLTSLENPTATHSRAGGDYVPKQASWQWAIGTTSMFLWALGLYPDKDTFYTTTTEVVANDTGAPFYKFQESYPLTHAIASSMSAGPITPSDGIGGSDQTLIMRMCAADGLLLKPDVPAINIESTWIQRSLGQGGPIGPQGEVITSYTAIGSFTWHFAYGVQLTAPYKFLSTDVLLPLVGQYYAFLFNNTNPANFQVVPFGASSPVLIPQGETYGDGYLWIFAPVLDNGWTLLGEIDKFIAVSKQRFQSVTTSQNGVQILLAGQPGELVNLAYLKPSSTTPALGSCEISDSGFSMYTLPSGSCAFY